MDNGKRLPVCKALLHFNTSKDEQVLVKVGVSAVDIAGARKNVESEIPGWDFEKVRKHVRHGMNIFPKLILQLPIKKIKPSSTRPSIIRESVQICSLMQTDVI